MSDLISRQAAIEIVEQYNKSHMKLKGGPMLAAVPIIVDLEELPSIELKHGNWTKISPAGIYECSECGGNVMTDDISCYHYCHRCGADMRGEGNG